MRSAIIKDGVVVNVIKGSLPGTIECPPEVGIGWTYDGSTFTPPPAPEPEPEPAPQSITMRQLLIGLMGAEWITPAQADAWSADGTLPPTITDVIDALPTEDERVAARITARKMSNAYRNDPLLIAAAQAAMPEADEAAIEETLDDAFRAWSQI